jgi:hypothetical protein
MLRNSYRPSLSDFAVTGQQLSCKGGGEHDKQFHVVNPKGEIVGRRPVTGWDVVCRQRAAQKLRTRARRIK